MFSLLIAKSTNKQVASYLVVESINLPYRQILAFARLVQGIESHIRWQWIWMYI